MMTGAKAKPKFEQHLPTGMGPKGTRLISVTEHAMLIPAGAMTALGNPETVTLWWAAGERLVGIGNGDDSQSAYTLAPKTSNSGSRQVRCKAAIRDWQLSYNRYEWREEGGLVVFGPVPVAEPSEEGA